ncbi:MAG TPA: class I SAM-dependent methyltransferase [Candidatus Paceibacterota bacterium]|nr:class I SAM-dependent methyltransferase [Candidatus Paceibacterota bacterium]
MPVYDKERAEALNYWLRTERPGELEFIDRYARFYGGPVLELASGAARVTKELARRGHTVVGLELSDAMLSKAREVVSKLQSAVRSRIRLVKGDMRTFAFARPFPLICIPFYSFWYNLDEIGADACVRSMTENLLPGGVFLVEGERGPGERDGTAACIRDREHHAFWTSASERYGFRFRYETYNVDTGPGNGYGRFLVGTKR